MKVGTILRETLRTWLGAFLLAFLLPVGLLSTPCLGQEAEREAHDVPGAYSLTAGMSLEQVQEIAGELQQLNPFTYVADSLPGSHGELETFAMVITPEEGLCRLQATSAVIVDGGDGTVVREKFDRLFEVLWGTHGKHQVVSTLLADSAYQAPHEWMTALLEKEQVLMTLWTLDDGSKLSGGLESIVLSARALKPTEGFLNIDYTFSNWPGCQGRLESAPPVADG
ncbi:MAG: hypothetical protein K0U98_22635 [Deltaproteobacteria bacterium]|nr:hypothetical protein [Deltaproteobacteria bacterium]